MSDVTIDGLATTISAPADNDLVGVWSAAGGYYGKATKANFIGATLVGGGSLVTGGFALTIPATGTAALLGVNNTFSGANIFNGTTNFNDDTSVTAPLTVAPANDIDNAIVTNQTIGASGSALTAKLNGTTRAVLQVITSDALFSLASWDNGVLSGARVVIGRNSNGSTPAPGFVWFGSPGGTFYPIWVDNAGDMRTSVGNTQPTSGTTGSLVGTQTSSLDTKDVLGEFTDNEQALAVILETPVYDFVYKSGRFPGSSFTGIITDYSPTFGMDIDDEHPNGKALNLPSAVGYTFAALKALAARVAALEAA